MPTSPTAQYTDFSKDVPVSLRPGDPFTDAEAELISQRIEALKRYLERLAEKVRRLEGTGDGPVEDGNDQLTEYRGLTPGDWLYQVEGAGDPRR